MRTGELQCVTAHLYGLHFMAFIGAVLVDDTNK